MIKEDLIQDAQLLASEATARYNLPPQIHIDIARDAGQKLASVHNANREIVLIGTLLMDCGLGQAIAEGDRNKHIDIAVQNFKDICVRHKEITPEEQAAIIACIKEHHGAAVFTSIESEICCNADCYRFLTVRGIIGGLQAKTSSDELATIELYKEKVEEKAAALTLSTAKADLEPTLDTIKAFLNEYRI